MVENDQSFDEFAVKVGVPLRQALIGALGPDRGEDGHALAMAYAWEHRHRVMAMESPVGYLFKVGRSQTRVRRKRIPPQYLLPVEAPPEYEPALASALGRLPEKQRLAVFLVVGCGWSKADVARMTGRSESTIGTLVRRGLSRLRRDLKGEEA
ncbi:RNA polymerase sigma factor [Rhabdothermincola salaria]|uniref:RNA polymerase sigma factor n=1 Tax=Rhabdothermincola salaria TaxID=2903142 RepID=UPI001E2A8AA1|nr:sigma-70 family RNA polymerase sigma factor [Rhabdothermincola salaria]MCD9625007.1 sigma-70 family RNA polymerase sigma factor [Rhabdothermincola salaria]